MNRRVFGRLFTVITAVALSLILMTQVVMAALWSDPVTIAPYEVALLSYGFRTDGTSTWTYTVTLLDNIPNGVSHLSLGGAACLVVEPATDDTYETNDGVIFKVESKPGAWEVKWERNDASTEMKTAGQSGEFTLVVLGARQDVVERDRVVFTGKAGRNEVSGNLWGPVCGTTAVDLASLDASSSAQAPILLTALALSATIATTSLLSKASKRA